MKTPMKNLKEISGNSECSLVIDNVLYEIGHWLWQNRRNSCACPLCNDNSDDDGNICLNQHLRDYDIVCNYVMGRIDKEDFEKAMGIGSNFLQDDDKR